MFEFCGMQIVSPINWWVWTQYAPSVKILKANKSALVPTINFPGGFIGLFIVSAWTFKLLSQIDLIFKVGIVYIKFQPTSAYLALPKLQNLNYHRDNSNVGREEQLSQELLIGN